MSDNKFIERLKGKETAKSVLEVKNQATKLSFANMPQGTSNAIDVFSDHRGNATAVLNGTTNWKISNSNLLLATTVSGDGQDFLSTYSVSGTGLWVNASYTFPSTGDPRHPIAMVFNPSTKWVLKVCGDNLIVDGGSTIDFTMLVKIGTANVYSKNFTVRESAGQFSKEFVIDFGEANLDIVKAGGLSTLTVQLLCGTANASARIYNGMSVLTCLQRKVDASAVSNNGGNVEDVLNGNMVPVDYFSNPAFIDQIEDGDEAYAVFTRDGDNVDLSGWAQPIPDQANNAGKFLTTDGSDMSWEQIEISNVDGLQTELTDLQDQINDKVSETSTANQVYGTDNNGDQTTYNVSDFGAVDDVRVNNVSVVTSKIANIDLTSYLKNTATATDAITVNGIANTSWVNGINIGKDSRINSNNGVAIGVDASADVNAVGIGRDTDAGVRGTAIGAYAKTSYDTGIAIGCWNSVTHNAVSSAKGAYQFGVGTNSTPRTLNVGWYNDSTSPSTFVNYQLLDGDTGLIPDARISTNIARSADVHDATITITQGGVTKGSFTLNQASGDTIALDAGGGSVDIDSLTITKNSDDELQAVATINANTAAGATNPIYDWVGTLAEYTAQNIESLHPDWMCYITDDVSGGLSVYTKTQVDNLLNAKVAKGHEVIAFQAPTSGNNYTWYRKYADGWVEMGGCVTGFAQAANTQDTAIVILPVTLSSVSNSVLVSFITDGGNSTGLRNNYNTLTTTSLTIGLYTTTSITNNYIIHWEVKGMAA